MIPSAYYSENDPFKAEVLRAAIEAGAIAPGDVDERSIVDVRAADLAGYTQCHFFAGGGFWSLALRQAGWPDDRPAWTGSCPCPSFSVGGKGEGFDDPRHLWPAWHRLIRECRPGTVFGEQADGAIGHGWLDLVHRDLETEAYAVGFAVLGAHSAGAPHIRQRLYFVGAHTQHAERWAEQQEHVNTHGRDGLGRVRDTGSGADADGGQSRDGDIQRGGEQRLLAPDCGTDEREHTDSSRAGTQCGDHCETGEETAGRARPNDGSALHLRTSATGDDSHTPQRGHVRDWRGPGWLDPLTARSVAEAGATREYWADCDWWYSRDEKYRPIGPGLFPLAHGSSARVGRLRLYGDAICVPAAKAFIEAYLETDEVNFST